MLDKANDFAEKVKDRTRLLDYGVHVTLAGHVIEQYASNAAAP